MCYSTTNACILIIYIFVSNRFIISHAQSSRCSSNSNCDPNYLNTEYSNILTVISVRNNEAELKCNDYTDTKGMYAIYSNDNDYVGESITFKCQNHNGICTFRL